MNLGILGAGPVGFELATRYAAAGHDVRVANRRGPESVAAIFAACQHSITPSTVAEVVECEVVFLATPWSNVQDVLRPEISWGGRILVDATNVYSQYKTELIVADLKGDYGSEIIARLAPDALIIKAFNTLPFNLMFAPPPPGFRKVLFVAGDDQSAVNTIIALIRELELHPVHVGELSKTGRQMQLGGFLSGLELFAEV
jgi:8-hydroxy-5-deazaflavin:NADPH oxidoreductase